MKLLSIDRDDAPDCEVGEELTLPITGKVIQADDDGVAIAVSEVGEKTYSDSEDTTDKELEVETSPAAAAILKKNKTK